jgi:hypothetical protein
VISLPEEFRQAWTRRDYRVLAKAVATGFSDPATSRALVVFNITTQPIAGVVVFQVEMPWRADRRFPPLRVSNLVTGKTAPHAIANLRYEPAVDQPRDGHIKFELCFECASIAGRGWDTYIAQYAETEDDSEFALDGPIDRTAYRIFETLPHDGPLPPKFGPKLPA